MMKENNKRLLETLAQETDDMEKKKLITDLLEGTEETKCVTVYQPKQLKGIIDGCSIEMTVKVKGNKHVKMMVIPVDSERDSLKVEGSFMSSGKVLSKVYLGVVCFNENMDVISSEENYRVGKVAKVLKVEGKSIVVEGDFKLEHDMDKYVCIAFYKDTKELPFKVIKDQINSKCEKTGENTRIIFDKELDQEIQNTGFNSDIISACWHRATSTYSYCSACGKTVPKKWTTYSGAIDGPAQFGNSSHKFRVGTKYVSLLMLLNYHQNEESEVKVKNLKITKTTKI